MEEQTAIPKWEYCEAFLYERGYEILTELGEVGWELVAVIPGEDGSVPTAYLKRPTGYVIQNNNKEIDRMLKKWRDDLEQIYKVTRYHTVPRSVWIKDEE